MVLAVVGMACGFMGVGCAHAVDATTELSRWQDAYSQATAIVDASKVTYSNAEISLNSPDLAVRCDVYNANFGGKRGDYIAYVGDPSATYKSYDNPYSVRFKGAVRTIEGKRYDLLLKCIWLAISSDNGYNAVNRGGSGLYTANQHATGVALLGFSGTDIWAYCSDMSDFSWDLQDATPCHSVYGVQRFQVCVVNPDSDNGGPTCSLAISAFDLDMPDRTRSDVEENPVYEFTHSEGVDFWRPSCSAIYVSEGTWLQHRLASASGPQMEFAGTRIADNDSSLEAWRSGVVSIIDNFGTLTWHGTWCGTKLGLYAGYEASGTFTPHVTKTMDGGVPASGEFEFSLYDGDGNWLQTSRNDASGDVWFSPLQYSGPDLGGYFAYKVVETAKIDDGIAYDEHEYSFMVHVTADPSDVTKLVTSVAAADGSAAFSNEFKLGRIVISKIDDDAVIAQGDGHLAGAVFEVFRDAACTMSTGVSITIDADGIGMAQDRRLSPSYGKFYLKEVSAPEGYLPYTVAVPVMSEPVT